MLYLIYTSRGPGKGGHIPYKYVAVEQTWIHILTSIFQSNFILSPTVAVIASVESIYLQ